jgi:glycosyltransferase involved in cell wall biosynthesis
VIDERLPVDGRDAGSDAMMSHIKSLSRLGYAVSMVGADELVGTHAGLEDAGARCLGRPVYASVEDVLRRQAGCFDLVYLHRATVASRYLALVRQYLPRARVVYSVADLHHVRLARQAVVEDRPELSHASRQMRLTECTAAWSADAVITHSTAEADILRKAVPSASVHVVPWAVPVAPSRGRRPSFASRSGVAFIGHGGHAPNADAARWLVEVVMPLVWETNPEIECLLVGSELPARTRALARPGVSVLGHVPDLDTVFDRVRLTVAPLRFGAGVKGKILTSLAAGTPCVMTQVAAEGLQLPRELRGLVTDGDAKLAGLIRKLHGDDVINKAMSQAGVAFVQQAYGEAAVSSALQKAVICTRELSKAAHFELASAAGGR